MTALPFIPFALPDITEAEVDAVADSVRSGWLTTGRSAKAFEEEFAAAVAPGRIAVAVNSATAGLHLALEAIGVGPGDEVIVPAWTFTATAEVVRYLGAQPVIVDVDPDTLNIDFAAADRAVTGRTKAVIPVHFAGLGVSPSALADFASRHGVAVVEDAAHAIPTRTEGKTVGEGSDAVVFSFYATKTMTTGEGGMVLVSDEGLANRMRIMRLHGISRDVFDRYQSKTPLWHYEVVAPGFKYNLPDPAAAMGRVQLQRSPAMGARRAEIAAAYDKGLTDLPLRLPAGPLEGDTHSWHLYVARLREDSPVGRDQFIAQMAEAGVGTSVHFIPLHLHPIWRELCNQDEKDLPVATREFQNVVSLPIFSSMTDEQVDVVIATVRGILA